MVRHSDFHPGTRTERESRKCYIFVRIFACEIVHRGTHIFLPALDLRVKAGRSTDAAKIKSQCYHLSINQPGGHAKDHLVMHRPAAERVRMANERDTSPLARRLLQDRLELPVRSWNEKIASWIHMSLARRF